MIFIERKDTPSLYAELYSKGSITGTAFIPFRELPEIINDHIQNKEVIDYGCGGGISSAFLKSLGFNVTGVDISSAMIAIAKEKDPNGHYIEIESGKLPFNDKSYDFVFSSFVLFEIGSKKEIVKVMQEIHRVLRNGGIYIFIVDNENAYYKGNWLTINTDFEENKNLTSGEKAKIELLYADFAMYDYYWTEADYYDCAKKAGLQVVALHKPLGLATDGYDWKDEIRIAPLSIYVLKKNCLD